MQEDKKNNVEPEHSKEDKNHRSQVSKEPQMKNTGHSCMKILIVLILNLGLFYSISRLTIHDHNKPCPENGTCSFFLSCDKGYEFIEQSYTCQVTDEAAAFAQSMIQNISHQLAYQWGDQKCHRMYIKETSFNKNSYLEENRPKFNVKGIFEEFQNPGLEKKFMQLISKRQMQRKYNFSMHSANQIVPQNFKISFSCLINKTYRNHPFYLIGIGVFCIAISLLYVWTFINCWIKNQQNSLKIYRFLQKQVKQNKIIDVNYYIAHLQNTFNKNKSISSEIWSKVTQHRISKGLIRQYQQKSLIWQLK